MPNLYPVGRASGRAVHDGVGGATLVSCVVGLAAGARVATPAGPTPIGQLRPGDAVLAPDGATARIVRRQTRTFVADMAVRMAEAVPVHVAAGALAPLLPVADLLLAPDQVVVLDGVSIRAALLVNGHSVSRAAAALPVTYVHLDLDRPAAILAEGIACAAAGHGPADLAAAATLRGRIAGRAGLEHGRLEGNIAIADHRGAAGWVIDGGHPAMPVVLEIVVDGRVVARTLADRRRPDLEMAGIGTGRCAFAVVLPVPLPADRDHVVRIRRAEDDADVPGSPLLLERRRGDPAGGNAALAALVAAAHTDAARMHLAGVLAREIDHLLQARMDRPGIAGPAG